ncbi:DEAD/DEAH box helicase domain-containing protein [Toxoplasma gondii TgCatPRC2]|uniref:ATP-dependent RNA helicase n=1 Tax=Toxoplasma gondii TgCatPRC2 TaxID=1130821 RepID=A0A151HNH8_TOXGO|nr:DEAD/DEAH box helicase domain-containing protein [Toxoplasma gondii TgCatPRC2]
MLPATLASPAIFSALPPGATSQLSRGVLSAALSLFDGRRPTQRPANPLGSPANSQLQKSTKSRRLPAEWLAFSRAAVAWRRGEEVVALQFFPPRSAAPRSLRRTETLLSARPFASILPTRISSSQCGAFRRSQKNGACFEELQTSKHVSRSVGPGSAVHPPHPPMRAVDAPLAFREKKWPASPTSPDFLFPATAAERVRRHASAPQVETGGRKLSGICPRPPKRSRASWTEDGGVPAYPTPPASPLCVRTQSLPLRRFSPPARFFASYASSARPPAERILGGDADTRAVPAAATGRSEESAALRFQDLLQAGRLSEASFKALSSLLGYDRLTNEQALLLPRLLPHRSADARSASETLSGLQGGDRGVVALSPEDRDRDSLIQARTGTGKTLCFLLAIIERLLLQPPSGVGALVIAPTRELATQILREAEQLVTFHPFDVAALVGGNSRKADELALKRKRPQILVCTPGRLLDHLENTFMFSALLERLQLLVLDEADRLIELGHLEELKQIFSYLPRTRQSLLFSATLPDNVRDLASRLFKQNYRFLNCVAPDEKPTHERVAQSVVMHAAKETATVLFNLLKEEFERRPHSYKIIVFFPTARLTSFFAALFREQFRIGVYEIHRRRESSARAATASRFSRDRAGVLFSSDVSARGVDYPDVSLVIQVCAPLTRELYIHRVGRTGRIEKEGRAVLLLNEAETRFLELIQDLPLQQRDAQSLQQRTAAVNAALSSWDTNAQLHYAATAAYASLLNHYKSGRTRLRVADDGLVIQTALDICASCGLSSQPAVSKKLATLLNLESHPKLKTQEDLDDINVLPEFVN